MWNWQTVPAISDPLLNQRMKQLEGAIAELTRRTDASATYQAAGGASPEAAGLVGGSDNDDVALAAATTVLRVTLDSGAGTIPITGIAGGFDGRRLVILGVDATEMLEEDTGSAAENRFTIGGGGTVTLAAYECAEFIYDGVDERWVHMAGGTVS